jgi:hypothetical protein
MFFPLSPAADVVALDAGRRLLAHQNCTCRELSWQLARTCAGVLVGTLERQHAAVVETVVLAAEASRAAEWWQLAAGSLISASLLYHHGRWMVWILLSIGILSVQALYVGWQTCMIFFNVVLCALPPLSCCFRLRSLACLLLPAPP